MPDSSEDLSYDPLRRVSAAEESRVCLLGMPSVLQAASRRARGPFTLNTPCYDKRAALPQKLIGRAASRLSLTAHERTALDERRIAPNKQVA